jgi:hypothetical protein
MRMDEKQIERIKDNIKKYRARLASEKRRFGGYFDSGGIRYEIPELYLQLGDFKGALSYFIWFMREFPDDIGMPYFNLFWSCALYQNKRTSDATRLAYKTAFSNTYLLDLICNKEVSQIDKSELGGYERLSYAREIVDWCNELLTKDFKSWLCRLIETEEFKANLNIFISLQKLIKDEPVGPLRSKLVNESYKLGNKLTLRQDTD